MAIWYHVVTVCSIMVFKLTVMVIGYLIARMGYNLLIKGVTGEFKFAAEFKGGKADLVSASPGIFFIFLAVVLLAIGVVKDKPFETTVTTNQVASGSGVPSQTIQSDSSKPKF